mmetsp:Transcript_26561/g.57769  ORF Transcript_26561/g.57769 Transcript_26561/m.57769 type:complete len:237 (+) Transcript_26561:1560-2270(+)
MTLLFCFFRYSASFPHAVVLPTPCRPAMRMTVGPRGATSSGAISVPISSSSSSLTNFTSCWSGRTPLITFVPIARSSMRLMKRRTTGKLTSASRSARRMSFKGSFMFSAVSCLAPESLPQAFSKLLERLSNISAETCRPCSLDARRGVLMLARKASREFPAKALRENPSEDAEAVRCALRATRWLFAGASLHAGLDRPAAWAAPVSAHGWTRNVAIVMCYADPISEVPRLKYNYFL